MKKLFYLMSLVFLTTGLSAQPWIDQLSEEGKEPGEGLSFFEVQESFTEYWKPYDLKNGYYIENGERKKAGGWKQFKRWEWYWETRVDPQTGQFPRVNTIGLLRAFNGQKTAKADQADWVNMGPNSSTGGYAGLGRINVIAFHPTDVNTFWIGAPSGGLWKTTDGGSSWSCLTESLPVIGVSGVVIADDYETSNTLYIATGDRDAGDNYSVGVLKSTDGGITWETTGLTFDVSNNYRITRFLADPSNPDIMLAATNGGIYRTTDGGINWDMEQGGLFMDMEYQPESSTVLYAVTSNYSSSPVVYKSEDGGDTWVPSHTFSSAAYRVELAVTAADPAYVYALACNTSSGMEGVYQSTDSGENFTKMLDGSTSGNNLLGYASDGTGSGGQGWYDLTLAVSPANKNTLWVGGINTWKSTDGGTTWDISTHWWGDGVPAVHADKHYMEYQSDNVFFEGNDGGIYKTTDGGTTWTDLTNGMVISQIYRIGPSQQNEGVVMTGLQDNGSKLIYFNDWYDVKGGDGMECIIDFTDEAVQYGTYVNGQIDRTTDYWNTATDISANIPGGPNGAWVTPYVLDPNDHETIFVGYEDLWKSEDQGDTWTKISNLQLTNKIRAIAVAPSNSQVIYLSDYYNMYKTTDGGQTWQDIDNDIPYNAKQITYITVNHADPDQVWITFGGYDDKLRIMETTNGGTTWNDISTGLPPVPANCVAQNILSPINQLYVGTDMGVFIRHGEADWVAFNQNLPSVIVNELEFFYDNTTPANSRLYAATYGRGLWKTTFPLSSTPEISEVTIQDTVIISDIQDAELDIFYTVNTDFNAGNIFTAYLSDETGDFTGETEIGSVTATQNGAIAVTIPNTVPEGEGYKVRVKSTDPVTEKESNIFQVILDNEAPVPVVTKADPESASASMEVIVDFGEKVIDFESADLTVDGGSVSAFTDSSGIVFTAGISPSSSTVTVSVAAGVAHDLGGNANEASNSVTFETTGVNLPEENEHTMTVFPNPTRGVFSIQSPLIGENAGVKVFDITGREILQSDINPKGKINLDLGDQKPGLYIIHIETTGKHHKVKVMLQ
ncbi:MAG: Ig-like domain-containing protein [Bacteroidales bacterium]|jgi:photosystem II stability/assembly factor-like uncharacterized protein|nr:Ig-like domain-containing protein [Bacteroidales bacterium]